MRIKIIGKQIDNDNNIIDELELVTNAVVKKENDFMVFDYVEASENDEDTIKTRLRVSTDRLVMTKISSLSSTLEFEKNKKYYSVYSTIYGDLQMEIYTLEYAHNLNDEGYGEILLKYRISISNNAPYVNILSIKTFA
ncbi:DUF1934 domain-containing protein [Sedimentibacter sp. zth1]|uniref:DUF1934 domain-containing protein n=1 Tax=Sedimentibacter sp. zth1 TaxID=2816908 RepID=UPI001A91FEE4|nr:DUF1934 domain-containing protein [Sedimentibacter sp. zth1]QSX05256.1 DUF1934 domain-containing protein [Sedimentibacter sp. zth1]